MISQRTARATVTVDLGAVADNVARLRAVSAPAAVWAVVKADAYGHGAVHVGRAAAEARAVVLLKGPDTLVADPAGQVAVVGVETHGLATAGSGDVLTGAIAALLAKGLPPFEAAVCAALAHARAGAAAAERYGPAGIIAGDVIDALPSAFRS